jgi:predicted DNA binding CopG/RHH family protein
LELDIGERGGSTMKKNRIDKNIPIGTLTKVDDVLPSPKELVMPEKTVKVTLNLNEESVKFFKKQASKHHTKYQKMIRLLLDKYTEKYSA